LISYVFALERGRRGRGREREGGEAEGGRERERERERENIFDTGTTKLFGTWDFTFQKPGDESY
jgi:hypothetical protein